MRLEGKVAIVTGGGRGIGRAIAEAFAKEGAKVVVTSAQNRKEIEEVAVNVEGLAIQGDITKIDDVYHIVNTTISTFGNIDILVNNAARGMKFINKNFMTGWKPFWEAEFEKWKLVIDTNINGVFLMTKAVVLHMLKNYYGRIINISINHETMKRKGFSPYGPSKAALESMSYIWAQELEGTGITLNILLPGGATATGMIPDNFPESMKKELLDPSIICEPAVYLASDEAKNVNGQRIIAKDWHNK
jgi:3-oxoacyl-[acyl-carrier protein] reductase